jgi:hypothetical protein
MSRNYLGAAFVPLSLLFGLATHALGDSQKACYDLVKHDAQFTEPPALPPEIEQPISDPDFAAGFFNRDAQEMHGVPRLRLLQNVQGRNSVVGVWDEAAVFGDHVQLNGRVRRGFFDDDPKCNPKKIKPYDPSKQCFGQHATHVAGTIASTGKDPRADTQGMAPEARINSFAFPLTEIDRKNHKDARLLCQAATGSQPIRVSNHSYGRHGGWSRECTLPPKDPVTGKEASKCVKSKWTWHPQMYWDSTPFDWVVYKVQYLSAFVAAGNDGELEPSDARWNNEQKEYDVPVGEQTTINKFPYGVVQDIAQSKNVITIGAINKTYVEPHGSRPGVIQGTDIVPARFTSFGPRKGGGIKPDLVAAGVNLESPSIPEKQMVIGSQIPNNYYEPKEGTSMATPTAAGIGALLNEVAFRKIGRVLRADEMKAILIHTAINNTEGPNYRTGWGSIRADYAGWLLDPITASKNDRSGWTSVYESELSGGRLWHDTNTPFSLSLEHIPGKNVRVTLAWLDEPGSKLVKDLDLVVKGPNRQLHKVWCLDEDHPTKPAEQCDRNDIDNIERVDVKLDETMDGNWTIDVNNFTDNGSIPFALVVSGLKRSESIPPDQQPGPEPGSPPLPSSACQACYDIELRETPNAASPGRSTVFQCDPVHILRYDRYRPSWAYVSFEFPRFPGGPGFPGISPGGPHPWNQGWAPRASIACRGDRYRCRCEY